MADLMDQMAEQRRVANDTENAAFTKITETVANLSKVEYEKISTLTLP